MAEFRLSYNPFTVETALSVKIDNRWVPVSEESGLLRISKMRMQRWLEPVSGRPYFDELREASGEDEIDICFSGTKEDLCDLQKAARSYMEQNNDVHVAVRGSNDTEKNSSAQKLGQLYKILTDARKSDYKQILPEKIWKYLDRCMVRPASSAVLVPLSEWPDRKHEIFSVEAWQMTCFVFPYEVLRQKETRDCLMDFSRTMEKTEDRFFERERFLFICHYRDWQSNLLNDVRKVFMEYGIQDIDIAALRNSELDLIDDVGADNQSEQYYNVQNSILLFNERYAEQYRIRKIQNVLSRTLYEQGYVDGPRLFRKVEAVLRSDEEKRGKSVSDKTVKEAVSWISDFMDRIDHLLDVNMGTDHFAGKGKVYGG